MPIGPQRFDSLPKGAIGSRAVGGCTRQDVHDDPSLEGKGDAGWIVEREKLVVRTLRCSSGGRGVV